MIGALWNEIDLKAKTWTIPKERMKANAEHRVPLTPRAVEILRRWNVGDEYVFGTPITGKPLSNMALLELLRGMRAGLRCTAFAQRSAIGRRADELSEPGRREGARPFHPRQGREGLSAWRLIREAASIDAGVGKVLVPSIGRSGRCSRPRGRAAASRSVAFSIGVLARPLLHTIVGGVDKPSRVSKFVRYMSGHSRTKE